MTTDEGLYQFASYYLSKVQRYREAIPPLEEMSHQDLVLAALVVFYLEKASGEATVWGMKKLGVSVEEIEEAVRELAEQFMGLN